MLTLPSKKIAVEPIYDNDMIGHIWVPDQAKQRCDQGIVKYIGPKVRDVKIGDHILFSGYTGTLINLEDEGRLIVMHENFVMAVIYPPDFVIPGIFFKDKSGEYFNATYEEVFYLMAKAFTELPGEKLKWGIKLSERQKTMPDVSYTEENEDEDDAS